MVAKTLGLALVAGLAMMAPLAAAQDDAKNETAPPERPDDAAWTESCPPGMMCAFGGADGNASEPKADEPVRDPDCENCRGGEAPVEDGATCMDGEQEGETCRDDVHYFGGSPQDEPADLADDSGPAGGDAEPVSAPADAESGTPSAKGEDASAKAVPAVGIAAFVAAIGAIAVAFRRG